MQSKKLQGGRGKQKQKGGAFMGGENDICPELRPGDVTSSHSDERGHAVVAFHSIPE
jgi:hypothetical protein